MNDRMKILIAYDGSTCADDALKICRALDCRVKPMR